MTLVKMSSCKEFIVSLTVKLSKLPFMIYANLESSATNYILLSFMFTPSIQVLLIHSYPTHRQNNIRITKSTTFFCLVDKVGYTWIFFLNNLDKLFFSILLHILPSNYISFLWTQTICAEKTTAQSWKSVEPV